MTRRGERHRNLPIVGWREWVTLPTLTTHPVKAKVDTGARTSAVHATNVEVAEENGQRLVSFELDLGDGDSIAVTREVADERDITSSNGATERRLVVTLQARLHDVEWPIEVSLTDRTDMRFPMLLGRTALRRRFWVDAGRSFLGSTPPPGREDVVALERDPDEDAT